VGYWRTGTGVGLGQDAHRKTNASPSLSERSVDIFLRIDSERGKALPEIGQVQFWHRGNEAVLRPSPASICLAAKSRAQEGWGGHGPWTWALDLPHNVNYTKERGQHCLAGPVPSSLRAGPLSRPIGLRRYRAQPGGWFKRARAPHRVGAENSISTTTSPVA